MSCPACHDWKHRNLREGRLAGIVIKLRKGEALPGPSVAAETLAKRLEFDDRPELVTLPVRSKEDQIAALKQLIDNREAAS